MLRTALIFTAMLMLALPVSSAHAALPPAHPPKPAELRAQGVDVEWPLTASVTLSRRHELVVPVRSKRSVTVALVVVDARGRHVKTVVRTAVRQGEFRAWVATYPGARMALQLDVGDARYWSWIRVAEDIDAQVSCEHGDEVAPTLLLGNNREYRSGHRFLVLIRNGGRCPLGYEYLSTRWQRPTPDGRWEDVPVGCSSNVVLLPGQSDSTICDRLGLLSLLPAGKTRSATPQVPYGLPPGRYRVAISHDADTPPIHREVDVVG